MRNFVKLYRKFYDMIYDDCNACDSNNSAIRNSVKFLSYPRYPKRIPLSTSILIFIDRRKESLGRWKRVENGENGGGTITQFRRSCIILWKNVQWHSSHAARPVVNFVGQRARLTAKVMNCETAIARPPFVNYQMKIYTVAGLLFDRHW